MTRRDEGFFVLNKHGFGLGDMSEELTKTQQKRLAKRERIKAKYAQTKLEQKKPRTQDEEEYKVWGPRQERNAMMRCDFESNCDRGPMVLIDCEWDEDMMTEKECLSLTQQIMYSYAANKRSRRPARLCVYGASQKQIELLQKLPGFDTWYMGLTDASIAQNNDDLVERGVYLTADTENVLQARNMGPNDVLVIGGIVDRNRHKNATVLKAEKIGMRTAQLPIGDLMKMKSSKVLAVNHVFEILTQYLDHGDWVKAFRHVIPDRKKLDDEELD